MVPELETDSIPAALICTAWLALSLVAEGLTIFTMAVRYLWVCVPVVQVAPRSSSFGMLL